MSKPGSRQSDLPSSSSADDAGAEGGSGSEPLPEGSAPPAEFSLPELAPLLPIRDLVVFPYMIVPLLVSREISAAAVNEALATKGRLCFLTAQHDVGEEDPTPETIHRVGTVGMIMRMRKLSDGRVKVLVQGLAKAQIAEFVATEPCFQVRLVPFEEPQLTPGSGEGGTQLEGEALMRQVRENLEKYLAIGKVVSPELNVVMGGISDPGRMADLVAANLGLKVGVAQAILETRHPLDRLRRVNEELEKEVSVLTMQAKIRSQAKEEMSKAQREYFLREQLRQIQQELGDSDSKSDEIEELRAKIARADMPAEVASEAQKQLRRLQQMGWDSAEATLVRTYLDWLVELPWAIKTEDTLDVPRARQILDEDHYDLEIVKERILEHLSVRKMRMRPELEGEPAPGRSPILCFVGPPGVGKTSLGRSIARALGRKFVRISLGGVRDEAEIRGHRRTYVGALPGRIVQGMKQAGARNPVFMLDEVDKLGADLRGDPAAALLEVLDPEQNSAFRDHYLNLPVDLSEVLFIATANLTDPIPSALRDRMEIIRLSGYSEEEKIQIARRYILPRQLGEAGLLGEELGLTDPLLRRIIAEYTREAGLRELERQIARIARKVARAIAEGKRHAAEISPKALDRYLGPPRYPADLPDDQVEEVGSARGLAWTPFGGEVLSIEAASMPGRGTLILTGQLGEVMKESAQAALSYARARALGAAASAAGGKPPGDDLYSSREIHIHVPSGAIPKDGPSAGVTMACALVSLLTGVPVKRSVAMTGEITLRGRVLPVGGLKEKILAAARAKVRTVIVPERNGRELEELPKQVRARLDFVLARDMDDVLRAALVSDAMTADPAPASASSAAATAAGGAPAAAHGAPGGASTVEV
jgi:ATP-dependent Lon protease